MKTTPSLYLRLRIFLLTAILRLSGWLLARLLRRATAAMQRSTGSRPAPRVIDGEFRRVDTASKLR